MSHQQLIPANPANAPSIRFFPQIGIAAGMRVLDVGCGNGDLTRVAAKLAGPDGEVIGIDSSEEVLMSARAVGSDRQSAPIRYETADLNGELPELGQFDAIIGRRVLMYLPDAAATLRRLARLAKPNGILAFQEHARADLPAGTGNLPLHRQWYGRVWDTVAAEGGDVSLGYRLADLMAATGLAIEQAWSEGVLVQAWQESFLPTLARAMLPRMIRHGIARENEVDFVSLATQIDEERRMKGGTIFWDLAFLVSGRLT